MAHRGVLFLDELGEFPPSLLDALRQPLEDGSVVIARKGISVRFPGAVQLVAATNPCPCGYLGDEREPCRCSQAGLERYRRRLSGPLVDRFDLRVRVDRVDPDELLGGEGEPSEIVRKRVVAAQRRQHGRGAINGRLSRPELDALEYDDAATELAHRALRRGVLSGRGLDRVRRVARTIADLDGTDAITEPHLAEALALRSTP